MGAVCTVCVLVYIYMLVVVKVINCCSYDEPTSAGTAIATGLNRCQLTPQSIPSDIYALCTVTSSLKKEIGSQNQYKFGNFIW